MTAFDESLLRNLAEWRPDSGRQTLTLTDAATGWTAAVTAEANDVVGCRAWELSLSRPAPVADLRGWAERSAARVSGLMEPLRLVEIDPEKGPAQLRSETPAKRGEKVLYYEVLLQSQGRASVRRYQATRNGNEKREQIAFALTHEALAKLLGDLAASA
jgi:hypothetical protein